MPFHSYRSLSVTNHDCPHRNITAPIESTPRRSQTVLQHVAHPPTRKRRRSPVENTGNRRRRVETEMLTPAQPLIDAYNNRKSASAQFPPKITPLHIQEAMRRYEQVIEDACAEVEASCASCGEFKAKKELCHIDGSSVYLMSRGQERSTTDGGMMSGKARDSVSRYQITGPLVTTLPLAHQALSQQAQTVCRHLVAFVLRYYSGHEMTISVGILAAVTY